MSAMRVSASNPSTAVTISDAPPPSDPNLVLVHTRPVTRLAPQTCAFHSSATFNCLPAAVTVTSVARHNLMPPCAARGDGIVRSSDGLDTKLCQANYGT